MSTIATGSQHSLHFVEESTYGVTPSAPSFKPCAHTSCSLGITKDAIVSSKLRGDRQIEDMRHGNKQSGGEIGFELEYGSFDDLLAAVLQGSWSGDTLNAGTTARSFTFERKFGNLDTPEWHRTTGAMINTMSLEVSPNAMVTGSFGVVGKDLNIGTAQLSGATYAADGGEIPFDSFTGSITEGGATQGIATSLSLSIDNGIESRFAIGSKVTLKPTSGKINITGSTTAYFTSKDLYEKFLNETESAIAFNLVDLDGNTISITLPRIKYTAGNPDVSDEGSVTVALDFQALYDSVVSSNILITRTEV